MNDLRQPMYCGAWRSSSPVAKIYERELWSLPHTADCFSENSIASDPGFSQPCSTPQDRERFSFKKKFGIITGRLVEKNASYTLVFEVACSVSPSMLSAFRCVSKWRTFWTFSRQKNHIVLEASSASAFLEGKTRVGCTLRHPFLFTFAYIKYIIVIKSSQLLSQIKFTPKYIFLYSWLILQSCTVWHQILVPLTNKKTNPF